MTRSRRSILLFALMLGTVAVARADVAPVGPEFRANTFTQNFQGYPAVAGDASGNFAVVWQSGSYYGIGQDGSRSGIYSQRHAANGTRLGGEFRVNSYTVGPQGVPSIGMAPSGEFVVAWTGGTNYGFDQDGSASGAFVQRYDASGLPLGPEFHANTYTPDSQDSPAVAVDGGGNFVVVWESGNYYGGSQDGSRTGIFGQRYDSSGAPLGSEFQVNTYTTDFQQRPAVAAGPAGNFVVVWQTGYYGNQDGDQGGIFGQRFSSTGAPVGPEFQVNTYTTGSQSVPAVAMDGTGNFVVAWQGAYGQDGDGRAVIGRQFDAAGVPLGDDFLVNTYTTGSQQVPSVASDPDGNFVVVWQTYDFPSPDGDSSGVFGQHFARTGDPLGLEFQVNSFTTGYQSSPRVAAAGSDFVVAWQSSGYPPQDGSGSGVFGQRLETTGTEPPARVVGTRLVLKDEPGSPTHRRLVIRSTDDSIDLGGGDGSPDDPTLSGARVRLKSAAFDLTYTLPASRWSALGPAGANGGFRYRDRSLLAGPIQSVQIRPGKLWVVGKGAQLAYALSGNPDPVKVTVQMGTTGRRHCMSFGGRTLFQPGVLFRATDSAPPGSCRF